VLGEGRWQPIIDRASHEALAATFAARKRGPGRPPTRLLTGLLRCYRCGHPMTGNVRRGVQQYQCKADAATGSCGGPSVSAIPADECVRDLVLALVGDSTVLADRLAASGDVDVTRVASDLAADETRLEELIADHYTGDVPRAAYVKARDRLERRIAQQRQTLAAAVTSTTLDAPVGDPDALTAWWDAATQGQRRSLVFTFVDRIELQPWDRANGRRFDENRLRIIWTA
jgi:site-specific DNA recombinase